MSSPDLAKVEPRIVEYSSALDRGLLKLMFRDAVLHDDRAAKKMTIEMDGQVVKALRRTGYAVYTASTP